MPFVTVKISLVVIPPCDKIPVVFITIPIVESAPLVVMSYRDDIPLMPYTMTAPLVVIGPVDCIPLVVVMTPAAVSAPLVVIGPSDTIPVSP
jgi:hypothetical protein